MTEYFKTIGRRENSGFTLLELLIVVAIVGVLSTIGVPTYRRMAQRAKQTEAKVMLGGVYIAETAFYSEYGGYGDNLFGLGVDAPDLQDPVAQVCAHSGLYSFGFRTGPVQPATPPYPQQSSNPPPQDYYNIVGYYYAGKIPWRNFGIHSGVDMSASTFEARAWGGIAPGVPQDGLDSEFDVWKINERRQLTNVNDGAIGTGSGSTLLCTYFYQRGDISREVWLADGQYARSRLPKSTVLNYHAWAPSVVARLERSALLSGLAKPIVVAWAQHMAYKMGKAEHPNYLGWALENFGTPLSNFFGQRIRLAQTQTSR